MALTKRQYSARLAKVEIAIETGIQIPFSGAGLWSVSPFPAFV
jgi:hypothetical protein